MGSLRASPNISFWGNSCVNVDAMSIMKRDWRCLARAVEQALHLILAGIPIRPPDNLRFTPLVTAFRFLDWRHTFLRSA